MLHRGTPITTTASGTVIRTGYTAGNGNYVRSNTITPIQLNTCTCQNLGSTWSTCKGDVIGRVGRLAATGPHVYRFGKNGRQVDALKLNYQVENR
jgi:murein DD-endopeptidase MepM/ murein hydrolase activator NlpD